MCIDNSSCLRAGWVTECVIDDGVHMIYLCENSLSLIAFVEAFASGNVWRGERYDYLHGTRKDFFLSFEKTLWLCEFADLFSFLYMQQWETFINRSVKYFSLSRMS